MKNLFLSLIVVLSIFLFACNKEENVLISSEEEAIVSNDAAADAVVETSDYEVDLYSESEESINLAGGVLKSDVYRPFAGRYIIGHCPDVTIESTDGAYPKTITLNYGDGVELSNGSIITGSIVVVVSESPRIDGSVRTVTFNNFYVDSVNIAGTRTITFNLDGNSFTHHVVGSIVITFPDGSTISRESEHTRGFVEGFDTPGDYSDDIFSIIGFTNSISSEGYTFSSTIIDPLVRTGTCRYIVKGIVTMSRNGEAFSELNYGDGSCDNFATITRNGETRQITIGRRHRIRNN